MEDGKNGKHTCFRFEAIYETLIFATVKNENEYERRTLFERDGWLSVGMSG
jgi:hypothetical protein